MRRFMTFGPAFVVLMTAAVTLVVVPGAIRSIGSAQTHATVSLAQRALDEDDVLERLNRATRNIATAVEPSVVHLDVTTFNRRGNRMRSASGSGWVYDNDGHVVTNAHVVGETQEVLVQFYDGHVARGTVVGSDPMSDIAVIRVEGGDSLEPARRATGLKIDRGDRVFAFGSPFGFKFSMSEGIVSGLGRSARTLIGSGISNFIQTDAAVNPGNSGGPLVDIHGRVVGMNVAIATAESSQGTGGEGQSAGISFAIPLTTIETRVEQILSGEPIVPGYLGVTYDSQPRTDRMDRRGIAINDVAPNGPAAKAGIKPQDIILTFNGQEVSDWEILRSLITAAKPDQKVTIGVLRGEEEMTFRATLGEMPEEARFAQLRPTLRLEFGLVVGDSEEGPRVSLLQNGSPASRAGFSQGQLILSVGGQSVSDADEVISELQSHGLFLGRSVKVTVVDADEDISPKPKTLTLRSANR